MSAYRRLYDSRHLQADCQEPGSAPEPYGRQPSMGYLFRRLIHTQAKYQGRRSVDSKAGMRNRQTDTTLTDRIKFAGYSVVGKYRNSAALRGVIYCGGVNRGGGGGPPTSVDARPATLATPPRARERETSSSGRTRANLIRPRHCAAQHPTLRDSIHLSQRNTEDHTGCCVQ